MSAQVLRRKCSKKSLSGCHNDIFLRTRHKLRFAGNAPASANVLRQLQGMLKCFTCCGSPLRRSAGGSLLRKHRQAVWINTAKATAKQLGRVNMGRPSFNKPISTRTSPDTQTERDGGKWNVAPKPVNRQTRRAAKAINAKRKK